MRYTPVRVCAECLTNCHNGPLKTDVNFTMDLMASSNLLVDDCMYFDSTVQHYVCKLHTMLHCSVCSVCVN